MQSVNSLKSLYKFKSFDPDGYYKEILNNILYFPSPNQLNDPFDCKIPTRFDLLSKKEYNKKAINLEKSLNPQLKRWEIKKNAKERAKKFRRENKDHPEQVISRLSDFVDNTLGIFSLSEKKDNILLWSHYTDCHRGFCLEFDFSMLKNLFNIKYISYQKLCIIEKIVYQNELPIIHPIRNNEEDRLRMAFLTKAKDWEYEAEWRIIYEKGSRKKEVINPNIIKNIYFGLLSLDEKIQESVEILKISNPSIGIYKAIKKKDEFGLEFIKITDW